MRIRHWIAWGLLIFVILGIGGTAYGFHAAGYEKYIVQTGSMIPALNPGDLVIDKPPSAGYEVGDIITFRHDNGSDLVTHRVIQVTTNGVRTKGDANESEDVWTIPPDFVQGVVAFSIPKGGFVVLFLSQPAGIGALLLVVVGLVLLWRLFFPATSVSGSTEQSNPRAEAGHTPSDATHDRATTIEVDDPDGSFEEQDGENIRASSLTDDRIDAATSPTKGRHSAR